MAKYSQPLNFSVSPALARFTAEEGGVEAMRCLLALNCKVQNEKDETTPLYEAAKAGHSEMVRLLLSHGANTEISSKEERSFENGFTPLQISCRNGHAEVVELLLEKGANLEKGAIKSIFFGRTIAERTPLLLACGSNQLNVVRILLQSGANKAATYGQSDWTPLTQAIAERKLDLVRVLITYGPNREEELKDAICLAAETDSRIANLLLTYALDNESAHWALSGAVIMKRLDALKSLLARGALVAKNTGILYRAVQTQNTDIVKFLLDNGAHVKEQCDDTKTLHRAAELSNIEIIRLLLISGANTEVRDSDGLTPLHVAIFDGKLEVVKELLKWNANTRSFVGYVSRRRYLPILGNVNDALELAQSKNSQEIFLLLKDHQAKQSMWAPLQDNPDWCSTM